MNKQYAIIQDGKVINVVVWDGESTWSDSDKAVQLTDNAGIGWDYANGKFTDNRPEPVQVDE
jgi:hypothetical protein